MTLPYDPLPFGSMKVCPKCGADTTHALAEYSDSGSKVASSQGRYFIDVRSAGEPSRPHLERNCPRCGWVWLEECDDSAKGATR